MSFQFNDNNKDKIPQFSSGTLLDFQNLNNKSTNEIGPKDSLFINPINKNLFENKNEIKTNLPPNGARFEPIQPLNNKTNNSFLQNHRIYKDFHD